MQKRIIFSVIFSTLIIIIALGLISYISINTSIENSLEKRLELSKIIGRYIDYILEENLKKLYDLSLEKDTLSPGGDFSDEKRALKSIYQYSIFTEGVFLLDPYGNMLVSYPQRRDLRFNILSIPYISRVINEKKPVISDVYSIQPIRKKVIFVLVPIKDLSGNIKAVAGGMLDPTSYIITRILKSIPLEKDTCVEVVDSHGIIISSNRPSRILTSSDHDRFLSSLAIAKKSSIGFCHRCHLEEGHESHRTNDIMAFAPLSVASWGVLLREPQEIVFSPAATMKKRFLILGIISIFATLTLAIGLSRSIVKPVQTLIRATRRIGEGDLSLPVRVNSKDEIGVLAESFDNMRQKLGESLEKIKKQNIELENIVTERTKQLRESQKKISALLKKVISSQEEERRRIARELHDETLQEISAFLMKMDMCRLYPEKINVEKIEEMREILVGIHHGIQAIIQNLRPSVLDDLGLESSIKWLLERNLKDRGINYFINIRGRGSLRLDQQVEITLFRIIQEAITNVARHSHAENVFVLLKKDKDYIYVEIEDDGVGFDVNEVLNSVTPEGRGLGIIGMKERAALFDGLLSICSSPGKGTRISLKFPLKKGH
ncbi:MAG TPA: HAMP domain-containing protein [Nitrospirae bacterium]|nr:HAMP domain-containing protein [Nitrospirota bacterium]